jgi:hypothetical protein
MKSDRRGHAVVLVAVLLLPGGGSATAATAKCKVGTWTISIRSFTKDGSKLIKAPAGRVVMAAEVVVATTKAGNSPGRLLDINLIPAGSRKYRGTIVRGEAEAMKSVKPNEKVAYTLVYPVEIKDKDRKLSIQFDDFSGAIAEEKLVSVC